MFSDLSRTLKFLLVTLFVYVIGVQCCQSVYAGVMSVEHQTMSCHETIPQDNEEASDCHCEYNPAQLSWVGHEEIDLSTLKLKLAFYGSLMAFQPVRSLDTLTFSAPIRPPPLALPAFIPSTVLLI